MYRQFLIYRNFFAAETPVVLAEGDTDNVYLTHAIRALAADFPELATIQPDGKILLKVRLYKHRKSSTGRILGLRSGGSGNLKTFIDTYKKDTSRFRAPGERHPVIVLIDNDSGAKPIRSIVQQLSKRPLSSTDTFARVFRNLYVVQTPLVNGAAESKIKDFFDATIKATELGGKTFDDKNDYETETHYGKQIFAHQVVRRHAASVNFDGFRPLLTNLSAVVRSHTPPAAAAAIP